MTQIDYQILIDAETWAFIDRTNDFFPPNSASLAVSDQRALYDKMCAAFQKLYPETVTSVDIVGKVPLRIYETSSINGTLVYFHGGGFVVGGLHSHDDVCAEICERTRLRVVSVDYRLAPEHKHPAAFDDALAATLWVAERYGDVLLAGDSAGGNLAASVAHALRGRPINLLGVILIYPGLGGDSDSASMTHHANAPMLSREDVLSYAVLRGGNTTDPAVNPLKDVDFSGLPPTWVFAAECDPLADDGRDYVQKLQNAGCHAQFQLDLGLVHGWLRARHSVLRAKTAFARIIDVLNAVRRT
ncbi:MAG: acetyl esterase [Pseudorhodobacter sp.]|jgi:acetyl esterase